MKIAPAREGSTVRRLRTFLAATVIVTTTVLTLAATAGATSFAVLLSGAQAGSDQDQTWLIAPTPGRTTTNVRVELTNGYWPHMHQLGRCTREQAATSAGCPANSRIAAVAAVMLVNGILPVRLTGYLAIENPRPGSLYGHDVLLVLDQNGAASRRVVASADIGVRALDGNPALRLSVDLPTSLTRPTGATAPARLLTLAVLGNDVTSGRKRWLRNPTGCGGGGGGAGGLIRATATYADGTSDSASQSPTITGCSALGLNANVMFNPKEYTLDKRSGFGINAVLSDPPAGALRSDPRSIALRVPGGLDLGVIEKLPVCGPDALSNGACPPASRTGGGCQFSGPPRIAVCGGAYNLGVSTAPNGSRAMDFALTLENPSAGGGGGGSGGLPAVSRGRAFLDAGGVVIVLDGLPQIDQREIEITFDSPIYRENGVCGTNPLYEGRVTGWSGAVSDSQDTFQSPCPVGIGLADPDQADADGDGYADKQWLPANFRSPFRLTDGGTGIDWSSVECGFKGWDGTIKGSARVGDLDGDGLPDVCIVTDATDGDGTLEIRVKDGLKGFPSIIRRTFTVDATPPELDVDAPDTRYAKDPYVETTVWVADDSPLKMTCALEPRATDADENCGDKLCVTATDPDAQCGDELCATATDENTNCGDSVCTSDPDTPCGDSLCNANGIVRNGMHGYMCATGHLREGPGVIRFIAIDAAGNFSTATRTVVVDSRPPEINFVNAPTSPVHGFPLLRFEVVDANPGATRCELFDSAGRQLSSEPCDMFVGADGLECKYQTDPYAEDCLRAFNYDHVLERDGGVVARVTHTDLAGNVGTAAVSFTVDAQGPAIRLTDPVDADADGDGVADQPLRGPDFDVVFEATDAGGDVNDDSATCSAQSKDVALPKITPKIAKEYHGKFRCSLSGVSPGAWEVTVEVADMAGNRSSVRRGFVVVEDSAVPKLP